MKKTIVSFSLLFIFCISLYSQSASVTGVKKISVKNIGTITENSEVKGYYFFFLKDKASKGMSNYSLNLFNNNLDATHTIEITKPSNSILLEAAYNGDRFCFSFLNQKLKMLELQLYDLNGKDAGKYEVKASKMAPSF